MKRRMQTKLWWLVMLSALIFWNCTGKQAKTDPPLGGGAAANGKPNGAGGNPNAPGGCIKGQVVNEEGRGFAGVLISTEPVTSPEVTDSSGFFELCNQRKVVNAETGETAKVPITFGRYQLKFAKDGFHARPLDFDYNGQLVRLNPVTMVEKTRPLPDVVETKQQEQKRDTGTGGKAPISE